MDVCGKVRILLHEQHIATTAIIFILLGHSTTRSSRQHDIIVNLHSNVTDTNRTKIYKKGDPW
jgi:hypothetical protein